MCLVLETVPPPCCFNYCPGLLSLHKFLHYSQTEKGKANCDSKKTYKWDWDSTSSIQVGSCVFNGSFIYIKKKIQREGKSSKPSPTPSPRKSLVKSWLLIFRLLSLFGIHFKKWVGFTEWTLDAFYNKLETELNRIFTQVSSLNLCNGKYDFLQ